jgi:hypothetical protein
MRKQSKLLDQRFYSFLIFLFSSFYLQANIEVNIEKRFSNLEIADTHDERKRGLMYRNILEANSGMLFVWEEADIQCVWMRNTKIPLSIAYIDINEEISNIYDMVPYSTKLICSKKPVKYAIEANLGWFKKNNITIGNKLNIKEFIKKKE